MASSPSPSFSSSSLSSLSHSVSTIDSSCPELSASLQEAINTNPPLFSSPGFAGSSRQNSGHPRQQYIRNYTYPDTPGVSGIPPPYHVDETAPLRPLLRPLLGVASASDSDDGRQRETRRGCGWRQVVMPWCQAVMLLLMGLAAAVVVTLFVVLLMGCVKAWRE